MMFIRNLFKLFIFCLAVNSALTHASPGEGLVDIAAVRTRRLPYCDVALQVRQSDQILLASKTCFEGRRPKFGNFGEFVFDIHPVTASKTLGDKVGDIVLLLFQRVGAASLIPLLN